ncbi:MAG: hypothetical protein GY862_15340 [Gammaproteobacteria bacterium]|nr:hypothetical protein [Gammaproteobacteria bacterium]
MHILNPKGDVGIATLWSRPEQALKVLKEQGIALAPESSRIAVIANLYGNGLPQMLRNLLWNPQIAYVLIMGKDLSGSREEFLNFFARGVEQTEYLGTPAWRISGTNRIIDGLVKPETFGNGIQVFGFGELNEVGTRQAIARFFREFPPPRTCETARTEIPIPKAEVQCFPSEPRNHTVLRATPLEAWEELIFRLVRFGFRVKLKKGERLELQNVKVIVEKPENDPEKHLNEYGFSPRRFKEYQTKILDPAPPEQSYTYGNRIRGYFKYNGETVDSLEIVIKRLKQDAESRHAYVSLWDNRRDLPEGHGCPCLVSLFFRRFEGKLTLTAVFRTHNAMDAWLENCYGLMAIQRHVVERVPMQPGSITVFSHSISISADALDRAKAVAERKNTDEIVNRETGKRLPRYDYNGDFTVTVDYEQREIVVQQNYNGAAIAEYRGKTAESIEKLLCRDCAVSEISHALYLGRELARKEVQLKSA